MIYIDCGFYCGNALKTYINKGTVDGGWKIYAFDPNPYLEEMEYTKDFKFPIEVIPKAVWTNNHWQSFTIASRHNAAHINNTSGETGDEVVKVKALDFSKFLKSLPDEFTICSMDIEGAEYRVLDKLLKDNTIDKIDILDVEFHHRLMPKHTKDDSYELLERLSRRTAVKLKEGFI